MAYGLASLFATTIHLFHLFYSYHDLMVPKYGCKREKTREARWRSAEEQKPHVGDGEGCRRRPIPGSPRTMGQGQSSSPHHTHEMFFHVESQGQKEAE